MITNLKCYGLILLLLSLPTIVNGQNENEIVDFRTEVTIEGRKRIEEVFYLIQVNSPKGDWISEVEIPYQEGDEIKVSDAQVLNMEGEVIRKLKKKEIKTKSDISQQSFYEDHFVKFFSLRWNTYPYRIRYSYKRVVDDFLYVAHWYPVVYTTVPVQKASLQIKLPVSYQVKVKASEQLSYSAARVEEHQFHRWEARNVAPFSRENLSPPLQELLPNVTVVPVNFRYGTEGTTTTWATYGSWQHRMNEGLDLLPSSEKAKVNRLIAGKEDKKEIIRILYHYMQDNTRYINVAIDKGGLKPYPASYVCDKRYGDCKALTIYMKALLKFAGIPSFYTTIYAGDNPVKIDSLYPGQQFNHVILSIPLEKDTVWLENTANYLPYNYLGTFTQNRYALLVKDTSSTLIKTPALLPEEVQERSSGIFTIDEGGKGSATILKQLRGEAFEQFSYSRLHLQEAEISEQMEAHLPFRNYKVLDWSFVQGDRDATHLELEVKVSLDKQFRNLAGMKVLQVPSFNTYDLEEPSSRKTAARINFPINRSDSLIYHLPFLENYTVEMPENVLLETSAGKYAIEYEHTADRILVKREFCLYSGEYPPEEYQPLYQFIEQVNQSLKESLIVLNPARHE